MRPFFTLPVLTFSWLALALASALTLGACGAEQAAAPEGMQWPAGWPNDEARVLEKGFAPTPYSLGQLRDGCPSGLRATYRVEEPLRDAHLLLLAFDACNDIGLEFSSADLSLEGEVTGVPHASRMTWADLQAHHSTPAADTVITRATVTVPAGIFDCALYTVTRELEDGGEGQEKLWFAFDVPGLFVRRLSRVDGELVREITLLQLDSVK